MKSNDKVSEIFRELVGDRAERLSGSEYLSDSVERVATALKDGKDGPETTKQSNDIGFHLLDWQSEAAFLVAIALFPGRFTDEEIKDGVTKFLIHAPHHVLEAANLAGYDTTNIFRQDEEPNQAP